MSEEAAKYGVVAVCESPFESQVGGDHYRRMKIQPIEFITANGLNFCEGNIIKYVTRHRHKNGKEDLLKARHYIDLLIESEYPESRSVNKIKCNEE